MAIEKLASLGRISKEYDSAMEAGTLKECLDKRGEMLRLGILRAAEACQLAAWTAHGLGKKFDVGCPVARQISALMEAADGLVDATRDLEEKG